MKAHKNWSYHPYRPPFFESGDIYVCRIAPNEDSIHLEWLREDFDGFEVYFRERGVSDFALAGKTDTTEFDLVGLNSDTDYEFYVKSGDKSSRVRLARCGKLPNPDGDVVVNYLHPDDTVYEFSGRYLCSPSLVRHPDGYLLASMDVFKGNYPQSLSLIFRSDDDGKSWHYVSELFPCFWGKLFIYENELYMLAVTTEYGDLLIGKSSDGGYTFGEPTVLLRGGNGKNGEAGVHKNPQPVVEYAGRIWNTLEYGSWGRGYHAVMVMSAPIGADLLDADSWSFSEPVKYDPSWPGLPEGPSTGNIEGTLVARDGKLCNIMRYDTTKMTPWYGKILAYEVDVENPEAPLKLDRVIDFPANLSKFTIKQHPRTGKYYTIASRLTGEPNVGRNLLSLLVSDDLDNWELERDIYDYRDSDKNKIGFQYVDFEIEGGEIIYLCRTAFNGAANFHDANYSIFGRIKL